MFVGQYAICFAIKRYEKKTSLGMLFIAVQFLDLMFFSLALVGIEKYTIQEHYLAASHLHLEYIPWSHSLAAAIVYSLAAYCIFMYWIPIRGSKANRVALLMAFAVFTHWILDYVTHTSLPVLGPESSNVGYGLWNNSLLSWGFETLMVAGAFTWYFIGTRVRRKIGKNTMLVLVIALIIINTIKIYGPPVYFNTSFFSIMGVSGLLFIAWLASRFEQYRA